MCSFKIFSLAGNRLKQLIMEIPVKIPTHFNFNFLLRYAEAHSVTPQIHDARHPSFAFPNLPMLLGDVIDDTLSRDWHKANSPRFFLQFVLSMLMQNCAEVQ